MILQSEIRRKAEREQVLSTTIDKDWVLGHLLAGIYSDSELKDRLIFKGGTCLRKCYYPQYRFSEDLDFTLIDPDYQVQKEKFERIVNTLSVKQEIPFYIRDFQVRFSRNKEVGWDFHIPYWGANHNRFAEPVARERWVDKVKLEIRHYELLVSDPVKKNLIHEYSDKHLIGDIEIPCYPITEILAEKFRSLIQRKYLAPRDCFDIWYLSTVETSLDWNMIKEVFYKKAAYKNLHAMEIRTIFTTENVTRLCKEWRQSLRNHLQKESLPDCQMVLKELGELIENIFPD